MTTAPSSRACSGCFAPALLGKTSLRGPARGGRSTAASAAGNGLACGTGYWRNSIVWRTPKAGSAWFCTSSIAPSSGRTGTRPGQKGASEAEALGRSRGGFTTKLHLRAERGGKPMAVVLTPGQRHEQPVLPLLIERGAVKRPGRGRPRVRPDVVAGDKAYSSQTVRCYLQGRGIGTVIPTKADEEPDPAFDRVAYRERNVVERLINWLKQWRRIATRYEKRAANYRAMVILAAILFWLGAVGRRVPGSRQEPQQVRADQVAPGEPLCVVVALEGDEGGLGHRARRALGWPRLVERSRVEQGGGADGGDGLGGEVRLRQSPPARGGERLGVGGEPPPPLPRQHPEGRDRLLPPAYQRRHAPPGAVGADDVGYVLALGGVTSGWRRRPARRDGGGRGRWGGPAPVRGPRAAGTRDNRAVMSRPRTPVRGWARCVRSTGRRVSRPVTSLVTTKAARRATGGRLPRSVAAIAA